MKAIPSFLDVFRTEDKLCKIHVLLDLEGIVMRAPAYLFQ